MTWRVDFADGGSQKVTIDDKASSLEAARKASRIYNRGRPKHIRALRAVRG